MKNLIAAFLVSTLFLACSTTAVGPSPAPFPGHIVSHCRIFDIGGKLLRNMPGRFCFFESDGSTIVAQGDNLTKFSKDFKPVWRLQATFLHHQLKKSELTGNFLVIDSTFEKKHKKTFRSDVMRVVGADGKTIRSIDFKQIEKQLISKKIKTLPFGRAFWIDKYAPAGSLHYETSHINSFYEHFVLKDGKREHAGYIANCYYQKKIIFLDKELRKVTAVIDTGSRAIHDVQMKEPGKIFFYQNFASVETQPRFSSLVEYDLEKDAFTELYSAKSPAFSSHACGSVSFLGGTRFMLAHSNCKPTPDAVSAPVLEFVDLVHSKRSILPFSKELMISSAEIYDVTGYLQNNSGM